MLFADKVVVVAASLYLLTNLNLIFIGTCVCLCCGVEHKVFHSINMSVARFLWNITRNGQTLQHRFSSCSSSASGNRTIDRSDKEKRIARAVVHSSFFFIHFISFLSFSLSVRFCSVPYRIT